MESHNALAYRREPLPATLRLASDAHLVEQVRAGSERAFEALFHRYHTALLQFCARMLGSMPEAEDAVQLTFMAAYRDLVQDKRPAALRPWLYAIARHRCLNVLRARRERPLEQIPEVAVDHLATEVATRDDLRAILADLATLPRQQRQALVLAELGDISHEDIAELLGCPRQKVKALAFQARTSLAAARSARETPCAQIREQLASLRGGSLRRALLRRHLSECPGCRAFRDELRSERRVLLPVAVGLKRTVLGALFGSGGEAGGALISSGAVAIERFVAAAIAAIVLPAGGIVVLSEAQRPATPPTHVTPLIAAPGGSTMAPYRLGAPRAGAGLRDRHAPTTSVVGSHDDRLSPPAGSDPAPAPPTAIGETDDAAPTIEAAGTPSASGETVATESAQAPSDPELLAPPTAAPGAKAAPPAIAAPSPAPTVQPVVATAPVPAPAPPSAAQRPSDAQQRGPVPASAVPQRAATDELGPTARSSSGAQGPANPRQAAPSARNEASAPPDVRRARTDDPAAAPTNPHPTQRTDDPAAAPTDAHSTPPADARPTQRADRQSPQPAEADRADATRPSGHAGKPADAPAQTADARPRDAAAADARPTVTARSEEPVVAHDDAAVAAPKPAADPKHPTGVAAQTPRDGDGDHAATADRDAQPAVANQSAPARSSDSGGDRPAARDDGAAAKPADDARPIDPKQPTSTPHTEPAKPSR